MEDFGRTVSGILGALGQSIGSMRNSAAESTSAAETTRQDMATAANRPDINQAAAA
jgi:hypothetical protein